MGVFTLREALAAASDPDTNPATLAYLAGVADGVVVYLVGKHPNTPPATLFALAGGERAGGVLDNPAAPPAALARLAESVTPAVRTRVAQHPNTSDATVSDLRTDPDVLVAYAAEVAWCERWGLPAPVEPVVMLRNEKRAARR